MDYGLNDFISENKKMILIVLVIIVISVVLMIVTSSMENGSDKLDRTQIDYESVVEDMGKRYYREALYDTLSKEDLKEASINGIKINLRTLVQAFEDIDSSTFLGEGMYCDFLGTYVIITPTGDFERKDYQIETVVSCEEIDLQEQTN